MYYSERDRAPAKVGVLEYISGLGSEFDIQLRHPGARRSPVGT